MKKKGFTLAEILIVLLIVGVVAALSIPSLVNEVNRKANETKAQSVVTDLETAFGQAMLDDDVDNIAESRLGTVTFGSLRGYMNVTAAAVGVRTKNDACITQNGSVFTIDVNCDGRPNALGRDRFQYLRADNGTLRRP